ncbi:MAG TPA: BCCT family transporter [Spirochaetota bacterium]|nr:BCCT family transporter [Spirochaetota bacterium]
MFKKNKVFITAAAVIILVLTSGLSNQAAFDRFTKVLHENIIDQFGWGYQLAPFIFLIFSLVLAFSKYGKMKLGRDDEKPQYSYFGWFSMLFAAGMGIGLIFWGVAEPLNHYMNPPAYLRAESGDAARFAMTHSFFHWGLQPWAVYIIMSLAISYFCFRRKMPPLISSCFYPLLGDRIYGFIGLLIDILAVIAVVFGIATSLGLGAMQIASGLNFVSSVPDNLTVQLVIIAVVTVFFMLSSASGLDRGIQILSKTNILLAALLLLFVFLVGPTAYILNILSSTTGEYFSSLISMSMSVNPFEGYDWIKNWTLFYWACWISWSPFVGLFVASISRGRTIREFVLGALLVPTLITFIWFATFGGAAFHLQLHQGIDIAGSAVANVSTALFEMFTYYPLTGVLTVITVLLLAVFFITSADSATHVLSMMTSQGKLDPPLTKKIFWGVVQSAVAALLLYSGGLVSLQRMAISSALPFTLIMLLLCISLWKGLAYEWKHELKTGKDKQV